VAGQAVFVLLIVLAAREVYLNLDFGVRRQGIDLSFDFLQQRAGFEIKEGIDYSPSQSFLRAFRVGVVNTIAVASVGIVLATVLGLVIGVARLSTNWLVRRLAQAYVELIRNVPVLVQIIFWYVAVILALPVIGGGLSIGGVAGVLLAAAQDERARDVSEAHADIRMLFRFRVRMLGHQAQILHPHFPQAIGQPVRPRQEIAPPPKTSSRVSTNGMSTVIRLPSIAVITRSCAMV
jgi:His/Glu/Gln/Arg/opine family amino acid ABC transporter permease subunit